MILSSILETPRLQLRSLQDTDASDSYLSWLQDPEVIRYLEIRFSRISHTSELLAYIQSVNASPDNLMLGIFHTEDRRHIGNIKLGPIVHTHARSEIGFLIGDRGYWGKGYAAEAIMAICQYGFGSLGLAKITAGCYEANQGSAKALLKAGFVHEATIPSHVVFEGRRIASQLYGLDR